jgi:hypothetical protein
VIRGKVLEASGLLGGTVGLLIGEPQPPVRIGHTCGVGNVTEVLADGLPVDFEGVAAKMGGEGGRHPVRGSRVVDGEREAAHGLEVRVPGEPEAWLSARTIRWIDASMRSRVCWE